MNLFSSKRNSSHWSLELSYTLLLIGLVLHPFAVAQITHPTISVNRLPEPLLKQYEKIQPQLTDRNRCFVVFSDAHDADKMLLECSFNTRIAAESERRALKYCEEKRHAKGLSSPCRMIID